MADSLEITNLREIHNALLAMGADKKEFSAASQKVGRITADKIQENLAPISRSGRLRNTVKAGKQLRNIVITVGNNSTATYAGVINFGWRKVGATHAQAPRSKRRKTGDVNIKAAKFIQKALKETRPKMLDTYLDALQELVTKYERKAND